MNDSEIKYKAFLTTWKVLGQTRPGISCEERFIISITATSDDKLRRGKLLNKREIDILNGKEEPIFSDALTRRM